ncbi:DUF6520 family protein [Christiangramia sp.]|uniref:DUF6520 family protein n=1 Tax=Christiangramia sp. TaxID=1931228 RepID=UPI0026118F6B|nr:DUF6520 family protein [Christiangramia sp.]
MKKLILIPFLSLLVVLGMSFTNFDNEDEKKIETTASDYVLNNGTWQAIPEQNCNQGNETCRVQFGEGGPVFDVYDEMDLSTLKESPVPEPTIINP